MTASDSHRPTAACPQDEVLVAYLAHTLRTPERCTLDDHLQNCDRCLHSMTVAASRLRLGAEIPALVPLVVMERARAALAPTIGPISAPRLPPFGAWLQAALTRLTRLPVLIPAAVAAGALTMIVTHQTGLTPGGPQELMRSAHVYQQLRIRAVPAVVRAAPTSNAAVMATLPPGTMVSIEAEEREWYRITLPDGSRGWLDSHVFD